MPAAITIIRDEHRSLAAVLQGLLHLVREVRAGRMEPDFALLSAMLHYIEAFPEKLHHPKEDEFLFRALRDRDPAAAAIIADLEAEHRRGQELARVLGEAVRRYQQAGGAEREAFARTVEGYAEFHWGHMRKEEDVLMPLAEKALTREDWAQIDAAFQSDVDPISETDRREMRELFRRIVHLAPAPLGVGPPRSK